MKTLFTLFGIGIVAMAPQLLAAPAAPKSVAATDGVHADKVRITWNASAGAVSYEVWRGTSSSSSSAAKVGSPTAASYDDKAATPGMTYHYWVKAKNGTGVSGFSASDTGYRISVTFQEAGSTYGYDGFTDATHPWKSVETGKSDTVRAVIAPGSAFKAVSFASSSSSSISVSPSAPASGSQTLTNQGGSSRSTAQVQARVNGTNVAYYRGAVYRKVQKTVAVTLVHEKDTDGKGANRGYTSTDIADSLIIAELKRVFKQSVVDWTVVRRSPCTVDFDLNNDGRIDVESWMSAEMKKIRDTCGSSHQFNIFLVNRPSDGSTGFMAYNQKYGFVHADGGGSQTVAHELGHGAAGLVHTPSDSANVMYNHYAPNAWRLRKNQWDTLNP